jgi:hypothetical protein
MSGQHLKDESADIVGPGLLTLASAIVGAAESA